MYRPSSNSDALVIVESAVLETVMVIQCSKEKCTKCFKKVTARQDAFECDVCKFWVHRTCGTQITHADYLEIGRNVRHGIPFDWTCPDCRNEKAIPLQESTRIEETNTK